MARPQPDQTPTPTNDEPWPPPAELAKYENAAERRKRIVPGVLMVVVGLVVGLLAYTATTMLTHHHHGEPTRSAGATTVITKDCDQYGPISRAGLGYWWECTADEVDGSKTVHTSSSELTPADIGKPVQVRKEGRGKAQRGSSYQRDVEHPLHGAGIAVTVIGFITVIALLGNAFMRLVPQSIRLDADEKHAERLREKYRHDGRL